VSRRARARSGRIAAIHGVMRSPNLRRLQLGWAAYFLVDGVSLVALSVWAFEESGTAAVGVLGVARLLPGGLALPLGAWVADRFPRRRVVTVVFATIAATQVAIAAALGADAPIGIVYALVAIGSIAASPYRPAHLALAPLVARSPEELVAINVTAGSFEGIVTFAGPALAALLTVVVDPWFAVAASASAAVVGMFAVARLEVQTDPSKAVRGRAARPLQSLFGGFVELRRNVAIGVIIGAFIIQLLVRGFLNVLLVSVSFELVDLGSGGVGWLAASMGIGGIVGAVLAVALTGRRRLGMPFARALVLWGGPIAMIGIFPYTAVAFAAMFCVGLGNALLDVSGFTLTQRLGTDRVLARVFGVLFSVGIFMAALGSVLAPPLISAVGLRPVLIGVGCILPALALVLLPKFRWIDQHAEPPSDVLDVLQRSALLAPLPPTTLEKLAFHAEVADASEGEVVVAEGAVADYFYSIAEGSVQVSKDGVVVRTLGAGDQFGEIALLGGTTRTATVTTLTPTRLVKIEGDEFVDALSSSELALAAGVRLASERSSADEPASGSA